MLIFKKFQAILVIDLEDENIISKRIDKTEDQMYKDISKIVSEWNSKYDYDVITRNCQNFVERMMSDGFGLKITKYPEYIQKIFNNLHKFGKYEIKDIFKNTIYKNVQTHSDLDYISNIKNIHSDFETDDYALGKSLDRAFWFNYFSLLQYKEFFEKTKKEFEKANSFLKVYKESEIFQILFYVLDLKYLQKKFPNEIDDLKYLQSLLEKDSSIFEKEEENLKLKLKTIFENFIEIANEKEIDLKEEIKIHQPILGKEFIKRYFEENLMDDEMKLEFLKCYEKGNGYYPKKEKLRELFKKYGENIPKLNFDISYMWDNYDKQNCYHKNPDDTHSIKKKHK